VPRRRSSRLKARLAIERDGLLLCALHAKPGREPFWCLPGGNVDAGEGLLEAAVRELREEAGVQVEADGVVLLHDDPSADGDGNALEAILRGRITAGEPALAAASGDQHLAELAWHPIDALPPSFRPAALARMLREAGGLATLPAAPIEAWDAGAS
jgi:8-oxo-dGTP diphosphatase